MHDKQEFHSCLPFECVQLGGNICEKQPQFEPHLGKTAIDKKRFECLVEYQYVKKLHKIQVSNGPLVVLEERVPLLEVDRMFALERWVSDQK